MANIIGSILIKLIFATASLAFNGLLWLAVPSDVFGLMFVTINGLQPLRCKNSTNLQKADPKGKLLLIWDCRTVLGMERCVSKGCSQKRKHRYFKLSATKEWSSGIKYPKLKIKTKNQCAKRSCQTSMMEIFAKIIIGF